MPKKMLFERRQARLARAKKTAPLLDAGPAGSDAGAIPPMQIPHQAITDSPAPPLPDEVAAGGMPIVRGNSNEQPLTPQGHATAQNVGQQLAALGGPDEIMPSMAARAMQTAADVSGQTGAPTSQPMPGLESHALGNLEGEPKTPEVKRFLARMIKKNPNFKIPGQGAMSNRPSESFNEFRVRGISALRGLMQKFAGNPTERILAPTSSQVIRLARAWCTAGCPDDMSIDHAEMARDDAGKPGEIDRLFPGPDGKWTLTPFSPKSAKEFAPGIYLMRHGETSAVQAQGASAGQKARAQIVGHVRSGNYQGAKDVAVKAHGAGHLSDQDISDAIDEALPTADDAARLPSDQLLGYQCGEPAETRGAHASRSAALRRSVQCESRRTPYVALTPWEIGDKSMKRLLVLLAATVAAYAQSPSSNLGLGPGSAAQVGKLTISQTAAPSAPTITQGERPTRRVTATSSRRS